MKRRVGGPTAAAMLVLMLVLLSLAWTLSAQQAGASMTGHLSAAAHEIEEGYFSIGPESYFIAKPGSEMHAWLAEHLGQDVTVSVRVAEPTE